MLLEIISILLVIDSIIATLIAFTKLGDNTIEKHWFVKRYIPITKGWSLWYLVLSLYITFLTF